jgi:hypothetical protein
MGAAASCARMTKSDAPGSSPGSAATGGTQTTYGPRTLPPVSRSSMSWRASSAAASLPGSQSVAMATASVPSALSAT